MADLAELIEQAHRTIREDDDGCDRIAAKAIRELLDVAAAADRALPAAERGVSMAMDAPLHAGPDWAAEVVELQEALDALHRLLSGD